MGYTYNGILSSQTKARDSDIQHNIDELEDTVLSEVSLSEKADIRRFRLYEVPETVNHRRKNRANITREQGVGEA